MNYNYVTFALFGQVFVKYVLMSCRAVSSDLKALYKSVIIIIIIICTYHPCKNQTNIVVTQASSAKRIHAWLLYV